MQLKQTILLLLLACCFSFLQAQEHNRLNKPFILDDYISPKTYNNIIQGKRGYSFEDIYKEKVASWWVVVSDRDNNRLYEGPDQDYETGTTMKIGQKAYVSEFSGSMLHLMSHEDPTQPLGWIHAKYLMLNEHCMISDKRSVLYKAMILISIEELRNIELSNSGEKKKLYDAPSDQMQYRDIARKFDFYFVLKEFNDWVLLADIDKLQGSSTDADNKIKGWIKRNQITEWNHRVCLEQSSDFEAVEAYSDQPVYVFKSEVGMSKYDEEGYNEEYVVRQFKLKNKRPFGSDMRMPIMNENNFETYKQVATIANIKRRKDAPEPLSTEQIAEFKNQINKLKDQINYINILFVVDGTRSLSKYSEKIKQSVRDIVKDAEDKGLAQSLRFSLAVYRDYNDFGSYKKYEFTKFTESLNTITSAIDNIKFGSTQAPHFEALFHGLHEGIKDAFESNPETKKQSNIVVLIGDAGDGITSKKKSDYSTQQIANLMYDNKVNFIAYQANYEQRDGGPYSKFNRQVRKILMQLAKKHKEEFELLQSLDLDNAYKINFTKADSKSESQTPMFGGVQSVRQDGSKTTSIEPDKLKKSVIESIKKFVQKKSNQYDYLETVVSEGGEGGSLDPSDINYKFLFQHFKDNITPTPSDEEVRQLIIALQNQGEISSKGWVKMEYGNVGEPAFSHVVFMPKRMKETKLQDALRRLITSGESSISQTRINFQAAMIALVDGILMEVPIEDILNMTFDEVWQTILGVNFKGKLGRYKIKDIKTTAIPDVEFEKFFRTFKSQSEDFLRQEYNDDFSQWKEGQQTYYWIPLEDLPLAK